MSLEVENISFVNKVDVRFGLLDRGVSDKWNVVNMVIK